MSVPAPEVGVRRMDKLASVVGAALIVLVAGSATADVLRGHLSGMAHTETSVDLRVRLFDSSAADAPLAERTFRSVRLRDGHFSVALDPAEVPPTANFVAIALRPSTRPYAVFRWIPPRRRLERLADGVLIAVRPASESARYAVAHRSTSDSTLRPRPGDPR